MKHISNKLLFQGGGKSKPKPKPPILKPPEIGDFHILNSYSVAEIIDLISDGPIEGLVNPSGQVLQDGSILQGVYLDNTAIETYNGEAIDLTNTNIIGTISEVADGVPLASGLNFLGDVYYNGDGEVKSYSYFGETSKNKIQHIPIDKLFLAKLTKEDLFQDQRLASNIYSPLNDTDVNANINNWNWVNYDKSAWVGNAFQGENEDGINIQYFTKTGINSAASVELHFDPKSSTFANGTLLNTLQSEIVLEKGSVTNRAYKQVINNVEIQLNKFRERIKEKTLNWGGGSAFLILKVGSRNAPAIMDISQNKDLIQAFEPDSTTLAETFFTFGGFENAAGFDSQKVLPILLPEIAKDDDGINKYTGKVFGCVIYTIATSTTTISKRYAQSGFGGYNYKLRYYTMILEGIEGFSYDAKDLIIKFHKGGNLQRISKASKYNFVNVSCEFKNGNEYQKPLRYFSNIYNDFEYNAELFGPFRAGQYIQKINSLAKGPSDPILSISASNAIDSNREGSKDQRQSSDLKYNYNYSDWNSSNQFDEQATSITHTIENPNVTSVYFTLGISNLSDTIHESTDTIIDGDKKKLEAGSKIPSIVNIKVEWGKIKQDGSKDSEEKVFSILALVEGQMLIDFGSPDITQFPKNVSESVKQYEDKELDNIQGPIKFEFPPLLKTENPSITKRFIKITKLSAETNSTLINKDIFLSKVTEIVENKLSYPFSALVGIKLDARSFSSIPERSYDCRLKKIKIPNNYKPLDALGGDKRYIKSKSEYRELQAKNKNQIYYGDWDGSFKIGWTDNPAWIIYDLLTNKRYGLGSYIEESDINKWELYKIARFCDAVDDNGFFVGVSDGVGGLEPRYSCNIMFREQTKIFDAINVVANLFRGITFFSNSEIHFLDDRPRTPIAMFTNSNVKDGFFNYANVRRDQQFNTVEVSYLDRFDNFQSKIEYVQDESDIRKRGIFKTTMNTMGVTSRAMARRIGQHIIYQTIKENQSVDFIAGLESLLCRPGDLIIVEDELKTRAVNYGKILDINVSEKSLRLDCSFDETSLNNTITVFTPTGYITNEELNDLADLRRSRVDYFDVKSNLLNSDDSILTGRYYFSGYVSGFPLSSAENYAEQYPVYTGRANAGHKIFCYYNTNYTGFVFSTGKAYQDNTIYDKVISNTGVENMMDIKLLSKQAKLANNHIAFRYNTSADRRGTTSGSISGDLVFEQERAYDGILATELDKINHRQITKFNLTAYNNLDYGSRVFIDQDDPNTNLISTISVGSPYRLERKDASDQIYKIISIREESQNQYAITASKYNTGKFVEIEDFVAEDFLPDTYYSGPSKINNKDVRELDPPIINSFTAVNKTASKFDLTGNWSNSNPGARVSGYKVEIFNKVSNDYYTINTANTSINVSGLNTLGDWRLKLSTLGRGQYLNSLPVETGVFVAYRDITRIDQPAIVKFTIL